MVDFAKHVRNRIEEPKPEAPGLALHLKYRPQTLGEVRGQDSVVKSLKATLASKAPNHCFLFTGPTGTGKTTLARIVCDALHIPGNAIVEHDGASKSGIDDMRGITENLKYSGFGDNPNKAILINECQGLSKQAWDSLLTTTEEPPKHAYFLFTSTNPAKIPAAMVTRCQAYHLKLLRRDDLLDELERVCEGEKFDTSNKVLGMVADACGGSMRHALTMLAKVHSIEDLDDVAELLEQPLDDEDIIELARGLVSGKLDWPGLVGTLKKSEEVPAETVRIIICAYLTSCLMGARSERDAVRLHGLLREFITPFDPTTKNAPLLAAFGNVILR